MKKLLPLLFVLMGFRSAAQIINIPDPAFKSYLVNHIPGIDTNFDGEIDMSEAAAVTSLFINDPAIADMTGIRSFVNLSQLICNSNALISLDISGLNQLNYLSMNYTQVTALDLSAVPGLTSIIINNNQQLTTLNVNGLLNLTSLNCMQNNISALNVNSLTNLGGLSCDHNNISNLNINGLLHLAGVSCRDNDLSTLNISNCPAIATLYCGNTALGGHVNHLTSLDLSGFPNLAFFNCDGNQLSSLDFSSCTQIQQATCRNNLLTSLNVSGLTTLSYLICTDKLLGSLNVSGCSALSYFDCRNNQITGLDLTSCILLQQLLSTNNNIASLNLAPSLPGLTHLFCEQNQLVNIDVSGAPSLQYLYCQNNQLSYVNLKNGPSVPDFNATNNPGLQYVCADEAEITNLQALLVQQGMPNVNVNSYCSFTPGGIFNTMTGTIRLDADNNGCSVTDPALPQIQVKISDGTNIGYTATNSSGAYLFYANAGSFTITPQTQNPYFTITPALASLNFATNGPATQTADFCFVPNGVHSDLEITMLALNTARPGFDAYYQLVYKNKGTTTLSGNVELNFDDARIDFINADPSVTTQSPSLLSWAYSNLAPFESRTIDVTFNLLPPPVTNLNDTLNFTANITPLAGDEEPRDNSFLMRQVIRGSFDPNDKICQEGDRIHITQVGDYVHYMVRFQNIGTDTAFNVVIKDLLTTKFDWNSFEMTKASHLCVLKQTNGNKLEFIFEDI